MLFGVLGFTFALFSLALNNRILNAILILSPSLIIAVYGPLTGNSSGFLALSGSVLDRIKYMSIFGAPFVIGLLGAINRRKLEVVQTTVRGTISGRICIGVVLLVAGLKIISIFGLKPVAGQGESIYVPIFASAISIISVIVMASSLIALSDARKALELMLFGLYLFLLVNCFTHQATWPELDEIFRTSQTDGFRFSPFAQLLHLPGRQAFFDTDPESFGVYSLFAFAIVYTSQNKFLRIIGSLMVFVVGSSTQSRLFYIVIILVILLSIAISKANNFSKILKQALYGVIFFAFYYFLFLKSNGTSENAIISFSGRSGIWDIVLKHWSDHGLVLGHQGTYSLEDYSSENSGKLIFFHAHNLILQYLWDWGLVGFLLVVAFGLSIYGMTGWIDNSGYILGISIVLAGLIEITLPNSVLYPKFIFVVVLMKFASSIQPAEKSLT